MNRRIAEKILKRAESGRYSAGKIDKAVSVMEKADNRENRAMRALIRSLPADWRAKQLAKHGYAGMAFAVLTEELECAKK